MHIVSREEMQTIDQYAIGSIGLSGPILMENAGRAFFHYLKPFLGEGERIGVMIGKGNNGGDGFVIARQLIDQPCQADVWVVPEQKEITGDAAIHRDIFLRSGGSIKYVAEEPEVFQEKVKNYTLIIDALLGTGFRGSPKKPYQAVIQSINKADAAVIAVDLPSGVPADGGHFEHEAVRADYTFTLQCPKMGMYTQPGAVHFGQTKTIDIGMPSSAIHHANVTKQLWTKKDFISSLPKRTPFSHKGSFGKGILAAGSSNMPGACALAAKAALTSGIGLLSLYVPESIKPIIASHVAEAMYVSGDIDWNMYDGIAIGPGIGRTASAEALLHDVLAQAEKPLLIDADGLYHLKHYLPLLKNKPSPVILTPHPGEMARLTGLSVKEVENDRFSIASQFAKEYQVYLILKGKYTIVTAPDGMQAVNPTGNPALAKGGTGDVLSGMILAFMLQHHQLFPAICNAVYLHGAVSDQLVSKGHSQMDVTASDIINGIPMVLHDFESDTVC
ncbi:NAD(P)H-hydrate dehydratase [Scopulibacillus cellulosilyticus]|uniref:Bifunctional NAD(P)H-hydrate repair enzyme n=1 Tax=Scopulibacillus cellulosilyticus TaxID=2665665 RepID=A0ABW2PZS9_9BACL